MPQLPKTSEFTMLQTLNVQIDLLDEKYGRKFEKIIKERFI